jgi:hypothetical protein
MASRLKKLSEKVSLSPNGGSGDAGGRENSTGYTGMFRRPVGAFDSFRPPPPPPAIPQPPTMYSAPPPPASLPPAQQDYYGATAANIPPATAALTPPLSSGYHSPDGSSAASINPYENAVTNLNGTPHPLPTPPSESPLQPPRPTPGGRVSSTSLNSLRNWKSPGLNQGQDKQQQTRASPDATTAAEPDWKLRLPKSLRSVANLSDLEIEGSIIGGDLTIRTSDSKKQDRKEGLCSVCSKIDFDQFDSGNALAGDSGKGHFTHKLIFLDRILRKKKKGTCNFCSLIFDAIAEYDPFDHPAVKDHLPRELVGSTFRKWADGLDWTQHIPVYKSAYPFGRSRDNVELQQDVHGQGVTVTGSTHNDQVTSDDVAKGASLAAVVGLNASIWTETDTQRVQIMATVGTIIPTITSLATNLDAKLPVAVSIIMHNANSADAGLLNVDVWGYGNAHRAPLSRISTFNLRIASGYQNLEGSLHYGKILKEEIDVEGDCKRWLENCLGQHGRFCDQPSWWNELPLPSGPHFRLIDVNAMRVVQINPSQHDQPRYAALSYVWGAVGKLALNLRMRNLQDLSAQLEGRTPPIAKTIRAAIDVTKRLGLPYLWVDSLCIIQKDERGEDDPDARASQIEQMDSIFGHAQVTLVAADGSDAEAGLCGVGISSRPTSTQIARQVRPNVNVLLAVKYAATYGRWDTRAWTLQEKLLSKRMLIFNGGYVSFHCRHGVLREDMPACHAGNGPPQIPWASLPEHGGGASAPVIRRAWDGAPVILRSGFFSEYAALLRQYTSREMTDSKDSLSAVLGLLKVLERMAGGTRGAMAGPDAKREEMAHSDRPRNCLGSPDTTAPLPSHRALDPTQGTEQESARRGHSLYGLPERFLDLALLWQPPAAEGVYLTKRAHDHLPSWSWTGWEVGKDPDFRPDAERECAAKPGVRFEEPFWVAANDDLSLRKVVGCASEGKAVDDFSLRKVLAHASDNKKVANGLALGKVVARVAGGKDVDDDSSPKKDARRTDDDKPMEERYKPLVMWYRSTRPPPSPQEMRRVARRTPTPNGVAPAAETPLALVPVNGHGLGLAFDPADAEDLRRFREDAMKLRTETHPPVIPADVPLDNRHLVCETQVARFRLRRAPPRREKLWKRTDKGLVVDTELVVAEAEVLDESDRVVGKVVPTDARKGLSTELYDFVLLSEAQYWGDETRVDVSGLPLYNVMVVEWDNRREFATRFALGKVRKTGWWEAGPIRDVVILK